jgi:hypothetical protein
VTGPRDLVWEMQNHESVRSVLRFVVRWHKRVFWQREMKRWQRSYSGPSWGRLCLSETWTEVDSEVPIHTGFR